MAKLKKLLKTKSFYWNLAILLIFIVFVIIRFVNFNADKAVHYHANFQIYINGQLQIFEHSSYYEELSACNLVDANKPSTRVHMHDQVPHLIHVHDRAVTYNHFFNNLGINLNSRTLITPTETYIDNQDGRLRFILNGQRILQMENKLIQSGDVLLVDFSQDDLAILMERYDQIPQDANQANLVQDPQSCLGSDQSAGFWTNLKKALGF